MSGEGAVAPCTFLHAQGTVERLESALVDVDGLRRADLAASAPAADAGFPEPPD
ncbi:hypothetical protein ACJ5H2_00320 [Nocardioides sp. R1-1]|uniref:hypothetical protein n=1 Tax=Nocardioides sp. R1-1 TaxID=3383502 RepID=UPI0038D129BA